MPLATAVMERLGYRKIEADPWENAQRASAPPAEPTTIPERSGFAFGIPPGGLTEVNQSDGAATQTDRKSQLQEMWEGYLACPWAWAAVQAISRTVTAGGLETEWDGDTETSDPEAPDKPPNVLALDRLIEFCNPQQDIRQLLRNAIADLLVFGDAFIEVVWWSGTPVALFNQDSPTTMPISDEHGTISKYVQVTDWGKRATFETNQIIHISLDSARPGVFGIGPMTAATGSVTAWGFAAATGKEAFRKGMPANLHVDFPAAAQDSEMRRWRDRFRTQNLGARNIGTPVITKGGVKLTELQTGKIGDLLQFLNQKRDEILAVFGTPPAKVGVIESGNLGGGTGDAQDKALDLFTMIPTPTGWTTMGELQVGDQVLDENGKPCTVTGTYEVPNGSSWRLNFSDGTYIDCCLDHLWVTWSEDERKAYGRAWKTKTVNSIPENWPQWRTERGTGPQIRRTEEIIGTLKARGGTGGRNHSIPVTGALDLPEADLPIDPYTLGAWLGDGTSTGGAITVGPGDEQVLAEIQKAGYIVNEWESQRKESGTSAYHVRDLRTQLRLAGLLGNKHVPAPYLRASAAQRLALLQGLMDTDGGFSSSQQVLFRNTREPLADAVLELARSLGQKPVKTKGPAKLNGVVVGTQYAVTWTPTMQVFRLARKAAKWDRSVLTGARNCHRYITGAEKIPDRPMRCIRVDSPNAMYLAGEAMIPTHNTYRIDTCAPIANILLEKLQFQLGTQAFGVEDWHLKLPDVDYRDSQVIEGIRDTRLRNGTWTRNRAAADIGEPPVEGGDDAMLVLSRSAILYKDLAAMSASAAQGGTPPMLTGLPGIGSGQPGQDAQPGQDGDQAPGSPPAGGGSAKDDGDQAEALVRAWHRAAGRPRAALESYALAVETRTPGDLVYAQLRKRFPADAIAWVKQATWSGPESVPLAHVDLHDKDQWAASHDGTLPRFRAKIRKALAAGKHPKPAVLVKTPAGALDIVADGHHHVLGAEAEGQTSVWAYTGTVSTDHGGWDELHSSQLTK